MPWPIDNNINNQFIDSKNNISNKDKNSDQAADSNY